MKEKSSLSLNRNEESKFQSKKSTPFIVRTNLELKNAIVCGALFMTNQWIFWFESLKDFFFFSLVLQMKTRIRFWSYFNYHLPLPSSLTHALQCWIEILMKQNEKKQMKTRIWGRNEICRTEAKNSHFMFHYKFWWIEWKKWRFCGCCFFPSLNNNNSNLFKRFKTQFHSLSHFILFIQYECAQNEQQTKHTCFYMPIAYLS